MVPPVTAPGATGHPRRARTERKTQAEAFQRVTLPPVQLTRELLECHPQRLLKWHAAVLRNCLRLSFVTVPPERIRTGIATLGELLRKG